MRRITDAEYRKMAYNRKSNRIEIIDFSFDKKAYGLYSVTYTSPKTGKKWSALIDDMSIIDDTKNEDYPTQKALNLLKRKVKNL